MYTKEHCEFISCALHSSCNNRTRKLNSRYKLCTHFTVHKSINSPKILLRVIQYSFKCNGKCAGEKERQRERANHFEVSSEANVTFFIEYMR